MGDSMLSTPQKVLRDTLKGKINSSTADLHSHVAMEEDDESTTDEDNYDDQERFMQERREALRQRGRDSYAKRKEGSLSSANTTPAGIYNSRLNNPLHGIGDDDDDDDDDEEGDIFYNESMAGGGKKPPRKKRKSGTGDMAYHPPDDGSDTEEDEGYNDQKPGSAKRRVSSGRRSGGLPDVMPLATTPPSKPKRQNTSSTANTVVSRFKEGSMRDRASAVPPQEIVGKLPTSSPARPEDEKAPMGMSTKESSLSNTQSVGSSNGTAKPAGGSFTFGGLASLIPFNPFKIAKDIKESWDRQKQLHEARERKKKLLRDRKKKSQQAYQELKRMGAMQGYIGNAAAVMGANAIKRRNSSGSMRVPSARGDYAPDYTMGDTYEQSIGRAYSTDESRPVSGSSEQSGNVELKRRKSALVTSFANDVTMKGVGESFATGRPYHNGGETFENRGDEMPQHSSDFVTSPSEPLENFSRKSIPKPKEPAPPPPSRAPPPPPPPPSTKASSNAGKFEDVKILVKKKSKVFASSFGRGEEGNPNVNSKTTKEGSLSKRDIKRQERLQKKVSNLEEQLGKARRELESALDTTINGSVPPLPSAPRALRREALPRLKITGGSVMSGEDTEGEETEIDEAPLSPVMNESFGGSFMAKTAEMTIMESVEETQNEASEPNKKGKTSSPSAFGMVLPKRISKSNLGMGKRRGVSGSGSGPAAGSSSASALRPQSKSIADIRGVRNSIPPSEPQTLEVPPAPRLPVANGGRK